MLKCTKCKTDKHFSDFTKKTKSKTGYQSWCKLCISNAKKLDYYLDKNKTNSRIALARQQMYKIVNIIKSKYGCSVCSETDICCLDFHHIDPNNKLSNIGDLILKNTRKKLFEEINKCIILCANCHRKFHAGKIDFDHSNQCNENINDYFNKC